MKKRLIIINHDGTLPEILSPQTCMVGLASTALGCKKIAFAIYRNDRAMKKQGGGTEIAGIDEGLDADETAISSNADTASEKSQSMSVWGIILLVVVAAIVVAGTVLFIRKKKKQN